MEPPASVVSRDRVLSDSELVLAMRAAQSLPSPIGPMFEVLFLTGQRRDEVASMRWEELDREAALWTLPRARTKNGEANLVPLSGMTLAALNRAAAQNGNKPEWPRSGFVFTTTGFVPVSGHSKAKGKLDAAMLAIAAHDAQEASQEPPEAIAHWRLHDARRTLATGLQRLGVRFEVTEAVLNHVSGSRSGVAGVYQRHGWGPEKRAALGKWAGHVEGLLSPSLDRSNVVELRTANGRE
jgi:integrase